MTANSRWKKNRPNSIDPAMIDNFQTGSTDGQFFCRITTMLEK